MIGHLINRSPLDIGTTSLNVPAWADYSAPRSRGLLFIPRSSFPWLCSLVGHLVLAACISYFGMNSTASEPPSNLNYQLQQDLPPAPTYQIDFVVEEPTVSEPLPQESPSLLEVPVAKVPEKKLKIEKVQRIATTNVPNTSESSPVTSTNASPSASDNSAHQLAHAHNTISAWINRHKYYPLEARRNNEEGTVLLRINIDSAGDLETYAIVKSSGSKSLDRAAMDIVKRAAPFPDTVIAKINSAEIPLVFALDS